MRGARIDGAVPPPRRRRWPRVLGALLVVLLLVALAGGLWLRAHLRASLALLEGDVSLPGLSGPVTIDRDDLGVPTIRGAGRADVARATGYVHAQERFFQMDLLRRQAAGELAELFGTAALESDRPMRVHRFRALARAAVERQPPGDAALLLAYTAGVNAGLAGLGAPPPEYLATRTRPTPWLQEDSLLVVLAMYNQLQGDAGRRESALGLMHDLLPPALFAFLTPLGDEWDAPLIGEPWPETAIPGPEVLDLRAPTRAVARRNPTRDPEPRLELIGGSNNWAVAGPHTADGGALVANDMHLGLGLPNIWFRAALVWPGVTGVEWRVDGVTLPGSPTMTVGSNGRVAWGFTNSQGDWSDLVVIEVDPSDDTRYRTPDGWQTFQRHDEVLRTREGGEERLEVVETIWGPIIDRDHRDRPRALRWLAHDLDRWPVDMTGMEEASDIEEAAAIANRSGIPTQNVALADATGRVGWTLMGPMPRRVGCDGRLPASWADGACLWDGRLEPGDYPRLFDPALGRIWTANNRVADGEVLLKIGDGGFAGGARARQIRDGLLALEQATPADLLAVQLDDRALLLERWRDVLLQVLDDAALAGHPRRRELREHVETGWSGRADVDSVGYRMVRAFRLFLSEQVFEALTAPCKAADERFDFFVVGQWEGPLWRLVAERPLHLLDPRFATWDEQLLSAVDETLDNFPGAGGALAAKTWGDRNTLRMQHPLGRAVPQLGSFLDIPPEPLPGDSGMPRVQSPGFGASQRMVVSPGREGRGIFHMPGGQSGHPLSPYYRKGHRDWAEGRPAPFLPGPTVHRLTLLPS